MIESERTLRTTVTASAGLLAAIFVCILVSTLFCIQPVSIAFADEMIGSGSGTENGLDQEPAELSPANGPEDDTAADEISAKPSIAPERPGWLQDTDGTWYYFDTVLSSPRTGWLSDGGCWFYLDPTANGAMLTGRFNDGRAWYIAAENGSMFANTWVQLADGWYFATASGSLETGWLNSGGSWYWLQPDNEGRMATGKFKATDGKCYVSSASGAMYADCWVKVGDDWYYAQTSGALESGWISSGGVWYWLLAEADGRMATSQWINYGGKAYYLGSSGAMVTGWLEFDDNWYWLDASGARYSGWVLSAGKWYWLQPISGIMLASTTSKVDGVLYSFDPSGAMLENCQIELEDNGCGYADPSGAITRTGRFSGSKVILEDANGKVLSGWQQLAGKWFYGEADTGFMHTGWLDEGGARYYLASDGTMLTGEHVIDGVTVNFNASGAWYERLYRDDDASARLTAAAAWTPYQGNGYCAKWTNYVYVNAGYPHPDGNACDLYWKYCTISNLDYMEPGMIIAVPSHTRTYLGGIYGHVAIYMGNGLVRHNTNKLETIPLQEWLAYYQTSYPAKCGWAYR